MITFLKEENREIRKIIHIDMDCFYAAVEMRDDPSLKDIPLAVGGRANSRGVLTTANYIARQYGVHSAMPTAQALKLCPNLTIVPVRMSAYKDASLEIQKIFRRYTDLIEPLSLDEAYLDVSGNTSHHGSATIIAREIRQAIKTELGLTASAGIAPVKFLAKIASDINKPDNQFTISPEQVSDFILDLPLTKIPGVGKVTAQKLANMGLLTCHDVQQYDLGVLIKRLGKFGYILYKRSHGIDERMVHQGKRKSVAVERTLLQNISDWDSCLFILEKLYLELELRLSKVSPDLMISKQGIKFKFDDFQATTQEHVAQVLDKESLFAIAHDAWQQRRNNRGVRLIGLQVSLVEVQESDLLQFELELPEIN